MKYYIKSENWQIIYSILKEIKGIRISNEAQTRLFLEGVYFIIEQVLSGVSCRRIMANGAAFINAGNHGLVRVLLIRF